MSVDIFRTGLFSERGWQSSVFERVQSTIMKRVRRDRLLAGAWVVGAFDPTRLSPCHTGEENDTSSSMTPTASDLDVVYFCSYGFRDSPFSTYLFASTASRIVEWIQEVPLMATASS